MSEENLSTRENLNVKGKPECKEKNGVSEEYLSTRENLNIKRKPECQKKT